jgi:alpha-amylase
MCNDTGTFDMRGLNHAGMVRENTGQNLSGLSVSTFVDNHDTGKEHDKWIYKDWKMGYAYILTHEGRPCIFYPHFYGITQVDNNDSTHKTQAVKCLKDDIKKLIFVRKTYLGGIATVLTEVGNPSPAENTKNVYVARRQGNESKGGAIIVLNNHNCQTKNIWVDNAPPGWQNWAGKWIKNAFNPKDRIQVQADGRVNVKAPARGYAIYVLESDYVVYK